MIKTDFSIGRGTTKLLGMFMLFCLSSFAVAAESEDHLVTARGENYRARTEHVLEDGKPAFINRLILEDSPYLLQHAHNPVNWYPWGEEAFAVMERESFEDLAIAAQLNEGFIPIKVDREQRPDVDASYMSAVTIQNGTGGWPMSSWLNVETKPFYGGTYYPPNVFTDLLNQITQVWYQGRDSIEKQANELSDAVASSSQLSGQASEIGRTVIDRAVEDIVKSPNCFSCLIMPGATITTLR